jgi:hypothetical protein
MALLPVYARFSLRRIYHDRKGKTSLLLLGESIIELDSAELGYVDVVVPYPIFRLWSELRTGQMI